jgi:predicted acylesterase/phospholipase RssA
MPDPRIGPIQTEELDEHHRHHRLHRDATILSACREHADRLPESPAAIQINRWGRNVANRQIGFTTSGGGACAYRTIAILDELAAAGIPVDVFGGLSGGAVIGAYYAGDECGGLHTVLARGKEFGKVVPALMISTKPMEAIVDKDFSYQRVGDTSVRFFAVTTELREGKPPRADIVTGGTLGQAVRVSGSLPLGFAPTVIDGKRFADGMASAIVPTYVAINHGADVTMACNCVPGPNSTNPFSSSWLGRMLYNDTPLGRLIDYSTWVFFLTQNASTAYGQGSDVFFQFDPERITTLESMHWGEAYAIYGKAKTERKRIKKAVDELKECWEALA